MTSPASFLGLTGLPPTVRRVVVGLVGIYALQLVLAVIGRSELERYAALYAPSVFGGELWRLLTYGALHMVGNNPLLDALVCGAFVAGVIWLWRSPWAARERGLFLVVAFVLMQLIQQLGYGAPFHLVFNLFMVIWFAPRFERSWGGRRLLAFMAACVLGGAVLTVLGQRYVAAWPPAFVMGFSAAAEGLLVAFAVYQPNLEILASMVLPLKSKYLVIALALLNAIKLIPGDAGVSLESGTGLAHLGGMATAFLLTTGYWRPGKLRAAFGGKPKPKAPHLRVVRPPDRWVH